MYFGKRENPTERLYIKKQAFPTACSLKSVVRQPQGSASPDPFLNLTRTVSLFNYFTSKKNALYPDILVKHKNIGITPRL